MVAAYGGRDIAAVLDAFPTIVRKAPLAADAQQPGKVWRIAILHPGSWDFPADAALFAAFLPQMNDLGYAEGKNLIIDKRAAQGRFERLPVLAMALVALHPDIIVAVATPATAAAAEFH